MRNSLFLAAKYLRPSIDDLRALAADNVTSHGIGSSLCGEAAETTLMRDG
jgi:hypothetical protein